jgi:tRNA (guanine-N7-)-methyltransferase
VWLEVGFGAGEHLVWQAENNPDIGIIGAEPYISGIAKLLSKIAAPTPTRSASPRDLPLPGGGKESAKSIPPPERGRLGGGQFSNIRIYEGDARDVIAALPDACLSRVFILFPDPWPKTRHHKRRFIQMEMLDQLARVMKAGAELRFATDDKGYLVWALERFMAHRKFLWTANAPSGWRERPADWPETRYEAKAVKAQDTCIYLSFRRH